MGGSTQPHTFFTHVPAPGELVGGLTVQPPEHGAVHVGGVDLHGPEHLAGGGEGEAVADLEALADEAAALQPSVQEHGAVFAELVAQVGVVGHPGQLLAVQLEVHQVLQPGLLADHEYIRLDLVFTGSGSQENSRLFWSPKEAAKSSWRRRQGRYVTNWTYRVVTRQLTARMTSGST